MIQPNVIEHFREAMRAAGLEPPDVIEPGKLQRFSTNGKASDEAGWCLLFSDLLGGVFGDHRSGLSETWQAKRDKPVNEAERNAFKQRCEQVKHERRAEQVRKHAKAASQAQAIWQAAGEASHQHPYLARKGVKSHGLRVYRGDLVIKGMPCDGCLMVAARDVSGFIHTLEFIHPDPRDGDNKRFLFGGDWKGHYFSLGKLNGVLCIAEGYATGATIHEATGYAVAVAFNAGNLEPVARALRAKFPDLSLVLCADDDISTEGNPGLAKATAAAHAVRGLLAMPDFGDNRPERATDFNDLAQCRGLAAVRTCIANAKPQALDQDQAADSAPADDAETF
ncbi:MAG TPA: toprim domain-containing protein, partial [Gammaproteobacteria bacterium]|nr:toprim domain-containing protein [Gammaproteobacteria bacterium]